MQRGETIRGGSDAWVVLTTPADGDGSLHMEVTMQPGGHVIPTHNHPLVSETYVVLEGRMRIIADGVERELGPGEIQVLGPGVNHEVANAGDTPLRFYAVDAPGHGAFAFTEAFATGSVESAEAAQTLMLAGTWLNELGAELTELTRACGFEGLLDAALVFDAHPGLWGTCLPRDLDRGLIDLLAVLARLSGRPAPPAPEPVAAGDRIPFGGDVYEYLDLGDADSDRPAAVRIHLEPDAGVIPPHRHPGMTESFTLEEGRLEVTLDGVRHIVEAPERVDLPPGAVHTVAHGGGGTTRYVATMAPAPVFIDGIGQALALPDATLVGLNALLVLGERLDGVRLRIAEHLTEKQLTPRALLDAARLFDQHFDAIGTELPPALSRGLIGLLGFAAQLLTRPANTDAREPVATGGEA